MSEACFARGCETGQGQGLGKGRLGQEGFSGQEEESVCSLAQGLVGLGSLYCCDPQVFGQPLFSGRTAGRAVNEPCEIREGRQG